MIADDTPNAIYLAGPTNWHHLLAPTRCNPEIESIPFLFGNYLAISNRNPVRPGNAIAALSGLSATAIILSNLIANDVFTTTAQDVFREALVVACELDRYATKPLSWHQTNNDAYRAALKILRSGNTLAQAMLLVDVIRAADQLTNQ